MEEKDYNKLRRKIVFTTLCFSLIPLFALGFSIYHQFSVSYTAKIREDLRTLVENRRSAIDLFFSERISQLTTLAYTHSFDQLKEEGYLDKVFNIIQTRSKAFVDLGVIGQDGNHVAYSGPYELKGVNYKKEAWFAAVMSRGMHISDVFMGFRKFPHFVIAVMRREGSQSWILRATIDTYIFDAMVRAAQVGKAGDAFVINRHNMLQTAPRFSGELLGKADCPDFSASFGASVEEIEWNGEKTLFAKTAIADNKWLLVIKEDPREALTPLLRARYMAIWIFIAGASIIVLGTILVARATIARLIQTDREKAVLKASLVQSSKMAALGKLAAGIAHEVNNPLAVIKEKAGWMMDLLEVEDIAKSVNYKEFEAAIRKIDQHVERAKKVTHRLLGFGRRMEPVRETVDINKTLNEIIDFLENEARYRNIDVQTDYLENLPLTTSDSGQLQQVFLNIFDNAIDAIGKNGEIDVKTGLVSNDNEIAITISDSGPGIPGETLDRIFDPFFTTKKVGDATGLGLSISYGIIEKLGGRITVESKEGHGTTFTVYLPTQER